MPFQRPNLPDIADRIRLDIEGRLPGADSRLRRSVLDVLARVFAAAIANLYGFLDWIARQILPDTADGDYLARWAQIWGVRRLAASAATGFVTATGTAGTLIAEGSQLVRSDGQLYRTTGDVVIGVGGAAVAIEAETTGALGAMSAGQKLQWSSPIAGVNAFATVTDGLGGSADEEGDEALRVRLLERIRKAPEGGSKSDYERWMKEVSGVTRSWVYPDWMGAGTVGLTFVMDGRTNIIPLDADVNAVAAYIDPLRPVTASPVVFAPTPVPLELVIRSTPATESVRAAITAEIDDLLVREAVPGGVLLISHIREAISVAAGEVDHDLASPSQDVAVGPGEMLVPGVITWIDA